MAELGARSLGGSRLSPVDTWGQREQNPRFRPYTHTRRTETRRVAIHPPPAFGEVGEGIVVVFSSLSSDVVHRSRSVSDRTTYMYVRTKSRKSLAENLVRAHYTALTRHLHGTTKPAERENPSTTKPTFITRRHRRNTRSVMQISSSICSRSAVARKYISVSSGDIYARGVSRARAQGLI